MFYILSKAAKYFCYKYVKLAKYMAEFDKMTVAEIEAFQLEKLNKLIQHFMTYPFYSELLQKNNSPLLPLKSMEQLKELPIVTKQIITDNLEFIASCPEAILRNSTSGSTGKNFSFYQSKQMLLWRRAFNIMALQWIGVDYWKDKMLTVWGIPPKITHFRDVIQKMKVSIQGNQVIQAYGMDEKRCLEILEFMKKYRPSVIHAYPTYGYELACAGLKFNVKIPQIKAFVFSGEMIYEHQIEKINEYFGSNLYGRYGSREFGVLAHQRKDGQGYYVHPAKAYIETDHDGNLLVTDLTNYATPFIRYAIRDAGLVSNTPDDAGINFQRVTYLQGRSHDIIKTQSGKYLPGQFWTTLSRVIPGIDMFQVVQKNESQIELRIKITEEYDSNNEYKLYRKLSQIVGNEIQMKIIKVDEIKLTPSGKRRFIITEM